LILLGFGIDQLSMNAFSVLRVKRLIRSVSFPQAKKICKEILQFATAKDVEHYMSAKLPELYKEEFWS
jgi:phosphotransferase system enzyme I (PtsI)